MKRQEDGVVGSPQAVASEYSKSDINEARALTLLLRSQLRGLRKCWIRIGALLEKVRTKMFFGAAGFRSMEEYAESELQLGRSSLYNYFRINAWVADFHKEWLSPTYNGFIPDLMEVNYLIRIESELRNENLAPKVRAEYEAIREKALNGTLRDEDIAGLQLNRPEPQRGFKGFLTSLRRLRLRANRLKNIPPNVITQLDQIIESIEGAIKSDAA